MSERPPTQPALEISALRDHLDTNGTTDPKEPAITNPSDRPNPHRPRLDDARVGNRTKLSALWVAAMILYAYVDIFSFYKPGTIDGIPIGRVWTLDITQGWALGALALMAVPTLMLVLSLTLPAAAARWTNVVVADHDRDDRHVAFGTYLEITPPQGYHVGQLGMPRRALGLGRAFG